jgi:hypothetical protein
MKGLLLSLAVFALYVVSTAVVSHVVRFERHSKLFLPALAVWLPIYVVFYFLTPRTLGILPDNWIATYPTIDVLYGAFVLILNAHSYMDFFFGFNGGFSTSLMARLMRAGPTGLHFDEVTAGYRLPNGSDKIMAWRLPRLVETGYLVIDPLTQQCWLTAKGRLVARIGQLCKQLLGIGKGG